RVLLAEAEPLPSLTFVDTAGCGFEERMQESPGALHRSLSRFNPEEALLLREHLLQLPIFDDHTLQTSNSELQTPNLSIGILSPYREQVDHLEALFRNDPQLAPLLPTSNQQPVTSNQKPSNQKPQISINTIDGFQGQERDIVYLSLVRSNAKHEIGFLQDYRRMNVAMTRARLCLVVIGDSATIGNNKFYQAFLDYVAEHGAYRTAWEFMG
ncbi:MAG: hypothetical protein JNK89_05175, partial [Saprospiraceae bacterium]|nr:hypothetical protein [Saprospiraceae bacterium]